MILLILEFTKQWYYSFCCVVFHVCGKVNNEELERLQQRGGRIVYFHLVPDLSTDQIIIPTRDGNRSKVEEKDTILILNKCLEGTAPSQLFLKLFQIRTTDDLVLGLESTKKDFFYKGASIFNNFKKSKQL